MVLLGVNMSELAAFYHKGESMNLLSKLGCSYLDIFARKLYLYLLNFGNPQSPVSKHVLFSSFLLRSLWKLDLCTVVLPQIEKLLQSKYER